MKLWTIEEEQYLLDNLDKKSIKEIALDLNRTPSSVRNKKVGLGIKNDDIRFTDEEINIVVDYYTNTPDCEFDLNYLSNKIGRIKTSVCRLANKLGVSNIRREMSDKNKEKASQKMKKFYKTERGKKARINLSYSTTKQWQIMEHPKGMLGKTHSDKYRKVRSDIMKNWWIDATDDEKKILINKRVNSRIQNYNKLKEKPSHNIYTNCKGGKREDISRDIHFRSSWEANIARLLNYLNLEWLYEPKRFIFDNSTDGVHSYLPDFYLPEHDTYIEVKGIMDEKSKTRLYKMKKYYPNEIIDLIDYEVYKNICKQYGNIIDNWEQLK